MRFALYSDIVSPHQLPLAIEFVNIVGPENYRYIYTTPLTDDRKAVGWNEAGLPWCICADGGEAKEWLENADVVMTGFRVIDLFEQRAAKGKISYYYSERWFKPPMGMWRLLHLPYLKVAWRMKRLFDKGRLKYLPTGLTATSDMARLCGLLSGDMRCLFRAPKIEAERVPMGRVQNYPFMRLWGYFVAPSCDIQPPPPPLTSTSPAQRALWVGRLLDWKRVDTLIRAVNDCARENPDRVKLTLVGIGPEERRLRKLVKKLHLERTITFMPPVPISEVRQLMRSHDVYVLPSNGYEGWGAVVSEALEEGMEVLGTHEAGSAATILPKENLFHAGDWRALSRLLMRCVNGVKYCQGIGMWSAKSAARSIVDLINEV